MGGGEQREEGGGGQRLGVRARVGGEKRVEVGEEAVGEADVRRLEVLLLHHHSLQSVRVCA